MAQTFALIAPVQYVLQQVSCSYETIPNAPKYFETDRNRSLGSNGEDWARSLRKIPTWLCGTRSLIAPVHPVLHRVSCSYETIPNAPKYYEMHRNISFGSNGVDRMHSLSKIPTWLCTNFCITCSSSPSFAPSFKQLRNDPKCTQTLWNTPEHEIRVQRDGSGVFATKNYNVLSWHKLLH